MIAIFALACGLVAGLAAGGCFKAIAQLRLRGEVAILVAFVVQGVARGRILGTTATTWGMAVWLGASVLLIGLLALNARRPGAIVAGVGTLINCVVVLANGAMPVLPTAGARIDSSLVSITSGGFYSVARAGMLGVWAGDVLPLRALGHTYLMSVGDVLLAVGVAVLIAGATLARHEDETAL